MLQNASSFLTSAWYTYDSDRDGNNYEELTFWHQFLSVCERARLSSSYLILSNLHITDQLNYRADEKEEAYWSHLVRRVPTRSGPVVPI